MFLPHQQTISTTPTACIRFAVQSRIEILHILLEHSYDSQRNEDAYSARRLHRRQPVARSQDSWCFVSGFGDGWVRPPIARRDHVDSVVEVVDSFARSTAGWCSSGIAAVGYIAAPRQTMPRAITVAVHLAMGPLLIGRLSRCRFQWCQAEC